MTKPIPPLEPAAGATPQAGTAFPNDAVKSPENAEPVKLVPRPGATLLSTQPLIEDKPRTPGLKMFDLLLYPVFTNVGVFTLSVAATYLTTRGGDKNAAGKLIYGKTGEFFHKRGEWMIEKFKGMGMSHGQADMSKMVFFSFLDGSLLAPFVKMFEDRREKIACGLDHALGTKPEDLSVYASEPKQTWLSVLGGRGLTAAIVVPTAMLLDKTGLNHVMFTKPGMKMGEWLAGKPWVQRLAGGLDIKEISRISLFEAFYTSVCTGGLYVSSRFIARHTNQKNEVKAAEQKKPAAETLEVELPHTEAAHASAPVISVPDLSTPVNFASRETPSQPRATLKPSGLKPSGSYREYLEESAIHAPALAI